MKTLKNNLKKYFKSYKYLIKIERLEAIVTTQMETVKMQRDHISHLYQIINAILEYKMKRVRKMDSEIKERFEKYLKEEQKQPSPSHEDIKDVPK